MSDDSEMKDASSTTPTEAQPTADQSLQSPLAAIYLDALPYVDAAYSQDQSLKEQVQQLLQEEMSSLTRTPDEYLADWMQHRAYQEGYQQFVRRTHVRTRATRLGGSGCVERAAAPCRAPCPPPIPGHSSPCRLLPRACWFSDGC